MKFIWEFTLVASLFLGLVNPVLAAPCDNGGAQRPPNGTSVEDRLGVIDRPCELNSIPSGAKGISTVLANILRIMYMLAGTIFLFMIVIGAIQWITSGGNKDSIANARKRIINALIGLVILALAAPLAVLIGRITGFEIFAT